MTTTAIAELMSSLSDELGRLAQAVERMHEVVCDEGAGKSVRDVEYVQAVQSIDHTRQSLAGLSDFLLLLAEEAPREWRLELGRPLASIQLADLKRRLSPGAHPGWQAPAGGEVELF